MKTNFSSPIKASLAALFVGLLAPCAPLHAQDAAPGSAAVLDFGDFQSGTLLGKTYGALGQKAYTQAEAYTEKCIAIFGVQAVAQQKALKEAPKEKPEIFAQWALNDVGVAYLLKGQALEGQGKKQEAIKAYTYLVENLPFSQCYDPQGWFWKPADAAKDRIAGLKALQ